MEQYSYSEGDADWYDTFLARCERQSKGYIGLSLTNYATSTVCAIAAGSVVEINGAVFIASANTSVSGSIATGLNYIICSVTGTTAAPYWSQTAASTYDTAKQGFYTATERYVAGCASSGDLSTYNDKWVYNQGQNKETRYYSVSMVGVPMDSNGYLYATTTNVLGRGINLTLKEAYGSEQWYGAVNLPHRAVVTELRGYTGTIDADEEINIYLLRVAHDSDTSQGLAGVTLTEGETEKTDTSIGNALIDNSVYSYFVRATCDTDDVVTINGIRITYTIDKPFP